MFFNTFKGRPDVTSCFLRKMEPESEPSFHKNLPNPKNISAQTHHIIVVDYHQLYVFGLSLDGGLADEPLGPSQAPRLLLRLLQYPGLVRRVALPWSDFFLAVLHTVCTEERRRARRQLVYRTKMQRQTC